MGALRYLTDCLTGQRVWRWYASVGSPERAILGPCARAAAIGLPLTLGPTAFVPGGGLSTALLPPVPPAPPAWHEGAGPLYWLPAAGFPIVAPNAVGISPLSTPVSTSFLGPVSADVPGIPSSEISPPGVRIDVPEPGTLAVVVLGAGAAVLVRRRRG
jgi:hypothetical protein